MAAMFHKAQNFVVNGGSFSNTMANHFSSHGISGIEHLHRSITTGAIHDSHERFDAPKCHPDTRIAVLDNIMEWIGSTKEFSQILWLNGPAGAGKSSIAQTICERSKVSGKLAASFFFSRNSTTRNNASQLFSTIAYQLAIGNPELRQKIEEIIQLDPSIVEKRVDVQLQHLIIEPLQQISFEAFLAKVIVIDGLDECSDSTMQADVLNLIGLLVRSFPIGFLITSRPEPLICDTFDTKELIFVSQPISLSSFDGVEHDIRIFLQSGFNRILNAPKHRHTMHFVERPWPAPGVIETLVKKSSQQFIYAATVLKFVDTPDYSPAVQLDIVLGIKESNGIHPLSDLDRLYTEILSRVHLSQRTVDVLGYIFAIQSLRKSLHLTPKQVQQNSRRSESSPVCIAVLDSILHNTRRLLLVLEQLLSLAPGEAYAALHRLHSLISVPATKSFRRKSEIQFHHASFTDFLMDRSRSQKYFIDIPVVHGYITRSCLKVMGDMPLFRKPEQYMGWIYAIVLWFEHFARGSEWQPGLMAEVQKFDFSSNWVKPVLAKCSFINWTHFQEALESLLCLNIGNGNGMSNGYLFCKSMLLVISPMNLEVFRLYIEDHIINRAYTILQKSTYCHQLFPIVQSALDTVFFEYLCQIDDQQKLVLALGVLQCAEFIPNFLISRIFDREGSDTDYCEAVAINDFLQVLKGVLAIGVAEIPHLGGFVAITIPAFRTFLDDPSRSGRYHVGPYVHAMAMKHILDCCSQFSLAWEGAVHLLGLTGCGYNNTWIPNLPRTPPSQELLESLEAATQFYQSVRSMQLAMPNIRHLPDSRIYVVDWLKRFKDPPLELIQVWSRMDRSLGDPVIDNTIHYKRPPAYEISTLLSPSRSQRNTV